MYDKYSMYTTITNIYTHDIVVCIHRTEVYTYNKVYTIYHIQHTYTYIQYYILIVYTYYNPYLKSYFLLTSSNTCGSLSINLSCIYCLPIGVQVCMIVCIVINYILQQTTLTLEYSIRVGVYYRCIW